jgi:CRP-like cAMP-binding protein
MDTEVWQKRLATLPLESYGAGETVFSEGTQTGRLLILKTGLVSIVKGGTEIARVAEPGVIFGEISALLDKPHTADVLTLAPSQFHVACRISCARPRRAPLRCDKLGPAS